MIFVLSHLAAGARALMLSRGVARLYPGIIATGDVRRGRDTKLVVPRNRWFESISLQGESANHRFRSRQGWRRRNGRAWYARFYPSSGLGPASLLASASARRPFSSASAIVDLCSPKGWLSDAGSKKDVSGRSCRYGLSGGRCIRPAGAFSSPNAGASSRGPAASPGGPGPWYWSRGRWRWNGGQWVWASGRWRR